MVGEVHKCINASYAKKLFTCSAGKATRMKRDLGKLFLVSYVSRKKRVRIFIIRVFYCKIFRNEKDLLHFLLPSQVCAEVKMGSIYL